MADWLKNERPDSYELPRVLNMLEDHEGMRDLLNSGDVETYYYGNAFEPLNKAVFKYRDEFLRKNGLKKATGVINEGTDLIAIYNLAKKYDIAVPIARGGLNQGAIADLWGMPTRILDISAHKRKVAKGKWINPVKEDDFKGKDVLFFDKDAVTGASIQKAVKMVSKFSPASIAVYFAHNTQPNGVTKTEGLPSNIKIFCPKNAPIEKAGDVYIEAHEKLETLYGRRRKMERLFDREADDTEKEFPDIAEALRKYSKKRFNAFDSLNPNLPGIENVREKIISGAVEMHKEYKTRLPFCGSPELPHVRESLIRILERSPFLPDGFEEYLMMARYKVEGERLAEKRGVINPHYPNNPLGAFSAAKRAVEKGFDFTLIIGPEGFAYEPYFLDFGKETLAVNIPESGQEEERTIKLFDDLSVLRGKKVLVVEDDVQTGATLKKVLEQIKPYEPENLDLFLGQSMGYQKIENIPEDFTDTFVAKTDTITAGIEFRDYLESKGFKIFKN